jgi:hypothetical protein
MEPSGEEEDESGDELGSSEDDEGGSSLGDEEVSHGTCRAASHGVIRRVNHGGELGSGVGGAVEGGRARQPGRPKCRLPEGSEGDGRGGVWGWMQHGPLLHSTDPRHTSSHGTEEAAGKGFSEMPTRGKAKGLQGSSSDIHEVPSRCRAAGAATCLVQNLPRQPVPASRARHGTLCLLRVLQDDVHFDDDMAEGDSEMGDEEGDESDSDIEHEEEEEGEEEFEAAEEEALAAAVADAAQAGLGAGAGGEEDDEDDAWMVSSRGGVGVVCGAGVRACVWAGPLVTAPAGCPADVWANWLGGSLEMLAVWRASLGGVAATHRAGRLSCMPCCGGRRRMWPACPPCLPRRSSLFGRPACLCSCCRCWC